MLTRSCVVALLLFYRVAANSQTQLDNDENQEKASSINENTNKEDLKKPEVNLEAQDEEHTTIGVPEIKSEIFPDTSKDDTAELDTTETQKYSEDIGGTKTDEEKPVDTESVPNYENIIFDEPIKLENEINTDNLNSKDESSSSELETNADQEIVLEQGSREELNNENDIKQVGVITNVVQGAQELRHPDHQENGGIEPKPEELMQDDYSSIEGLPVNSEELDDKPEHIDHSKSGPETEGSHSGMDEKKQNKLSMTEEQSSDLAKEHIDHSKSDDDEEDDDEEEDDLSEGMEEEQAGYKLLKEMGYINEDFQKEIHDTTEALKREQTKSDSNSDESSEALGAMMDTISELKDIRKNYEKLQEEQVQQQATDEKSNEAVVQDIEKLDEENVERSRHLHEISGENADETASNSGAKNVVQGVHELRHPDHQENSGVESKSEELVQDHYSSIEGLPVNSEELDDKPEHIDHSKSDPETEGSHSGMDEKKQYKLSMTEEQSDLAKEEINAKVDEKLYDPHHSRIVSKYSSVSDDDEEEDDEEEDNLSEGMEEEQAGYKLLKEMGYINEDFQKEIHDTTEALKREQTKSDSNSDESSEALSAMMDTISELKDIRKNYEKLQEEQVQQQVTGEKSNEAVVQDIEKLDEENVERSRHLHEISGENADETASNSGAKNDENVVVHDDENVETVNEETVEPMLNSASHDADEVDNGLDSRTADNDQSSMGDHSATPLPKEEEKRVEPGEQLYNDAMGLLNNTKTKSDKRIILLLEKAAYEHSHPKSQEYLGKCYLFGEQVNRNFSRAFELFERAATVGSPKAQQMLGFLYASGIKVNSSQSKALVYLMFSALGGDTMAQMALGYRYFSGTTVTENCETSLTYYRRVASTVVADISLTGGPAVQRIRLVEDVDQNGLRATLDEDLIQYYQFLADKGDIQAQVGLGQLHLQGGRGVELDHIRAFRYFQLAADAGNANAYAHLGKMYLGNNAVKADNVTAMKFFKKAADMGNPVGQSGVGLMYLLGQGVERDYNKAIQYFKLAAEQGWVDGQLHLGTMFFHGLGVTRDYKQSFKFFNLASQSGNVQAIYYLATMHSSGTGVTRSCRTATEFFKNVAERGRWSFMLMDAYKAYKAGNIDEPLLKYAYLAELGYETAQSNVAFILDQEFNTVLSDNYTYPRALLYFTRAAEQGNVVARVKVGDYHYYGHGTKVNYETAAFHYTIAQERFRSPQAMFNLGYMYERGLGMKQDLHLAKRFYDMAAEASPDAQAPVALALLRLGLVYCLEWFQNNYNFWSYLHVGFEQYVGKEWDIYVMTILAVLLGFILLLRWRT